MITTTIRSELEDYLKSAGMTINRFAQMSSVNSGTISSIINGTRPISMQQLDLITSGMGLPEGAFYELYVEECFSHSPNWRRLRPFLYRCMELNKLDCIAKIVHMMMDNLVYLPSLFDTAEDWYHQGKFAAAAIIYECVAESEKYQHSERLALCQYRLFSISIGSDQEKNLHAAAKFESYVERLDEGDQLDAFKDLANTYAALGRWNKVEQIAEKMEKKASLLYNNKYRGSGRFLLNKEPSRPLFLYIIYSYLLRSGVYDERGDYEQALRYVSLYSNLDWVVEDSEEALQIIDQYKMWATANTYQYKLMMGHIDVLPDYVSYIESRPDEILPALYKILQAANRFGLNIESVLQKFEQEICLFAEGLGLTGTYNEQVASDRYTRFLIELAIYYLNSQRYDIGIQYLLDGLESAIKIHNSGAVLDCVQCFEKFRHVTSSEIQHRYKTIVSEAEIK